MVAIQHLEPRGLRRLGKHTIRACELDRIRSLDAELAPKFLTDPRDQNRGREGRADGSSRQATELSVAVARSIVPPTSAKMKRAKPVAAEPTPATAGKKPFGMSYDGTSRADYIKLMISRGAR